MKNREESILSTQNILNINLLLEQNEDLLDDIMYYHFLEKNDLELNSKLNEILDENQIKIFNEYAANIDNLYESKFYVAYLIGLKKGLKIGEETGNIKTNK